MSKEKYLCVTLVRSLAGRLQLHKATIATLGLRRMHQAVKVKDTATVRGMLKQVGYLLKIEEINN
jgi:large subunit ribosomal protein L30